MRWGEHGYDLATTVSRTKMTCFYYYICSLRAHVSSHLLWLTVADGALAQMVIYKTDIYFWSRTDPIFLVFHATSSSSSTQPEQTLNMASASEVRKASLGKDPTDRQNTETAPAEAYSPTLQ
jgi:hypothetical protein